MRRIGSIGLMFMLAMPTSALAADIAYRVTFDATWSATTHPQSFPVDAHFSPPVGGVHNEDVVFWEVGGLASPAIEAMAETGDVWPMTTEVEAAAALGHVYGPTVYADFIFSPGTTFGEFVANASFSKFTLVTMIAPSPDWFVGTSGLELFKDGRWRDNLVVDLLAYDSGTDSGATYFSANLDTSPPEPITLIQTAPLATNGYAPPIGTYTFVILDVDGRPPYGDADTDGLTNLREAELGSDPLSDDSDMDTILDGSDNCLLTANATQLDVDVDGVGDDCDNCPTTGNPPQADFDDDGTGDRCDLNDGRVLFTASTATSWKWQLESVYTEFNLYRGDLQVLLEGGDYVQDPATAIAAQWCGMTSASANDLFVPQAGEAVFYLVAGVAAGVQGPLGQDSAGSPRPAGFSCP